MNEISLCRANSALLDSVYALWRETFADSDAWLDFFFAHHPIEQTLVAVQGEQVVSMLTMLPCAYKSVAGTRPACYLYAIATAESHRGQGLAARLIETAAAEQAALGTELLIVAPAHFSLFFYYADKGFTDYFFVSEQLYHVQELPEFAGETAPLSADVLFRLRERILSDFVSWDKEAVSFAIKAAQRAGGGALHIKIIGGEAAALYTVDGDTAFINELILNGCMEEEAVSAVHRAVGAARYIVRTNGYNEEDPMPFAQVRVLAGAPALAFNPPYLGLTLD